MYKKIYFSLDVNDEFITLVAQDINDKSQSVVGFDKIETKGYKNFQVTNQHEFVAQIKKLVSNFEQKNLMKVGSIGVVINSKSTNIAIRTKTVKLDKNKPISELEVKMALDGLKELITTDVKTVICALPLTYRVDYEKVVSPISLMGKSLEVKTLLISSPTKDLYEYLYAIELAGLDICEIVPSYIASVFETFDASDNRKRLMLFDFGYNHLQVVAFESGVVSNIMNFEFGLNDFKNEIIAKFGINDEAFDKVFEVICKSKIANLEQVILLNNTSGEQEEFNLKDIKTELNDIVVQTLSFVKQDVLDNVTDFSEAIYINILSDLENLKELSDLTINREAKIIKNDPNIFGESIYTNNLGANLFVAYLEELIGIQVKNVEIFEIKYEKAPVVQETIELPKIEQNVEETPNEVEEEEFEEYHVVEKKDNSKVRSWWQKIKEKVFDNKGE